MRHHVPVVLVVAAALVLGRQAAAQQRDEKSVKKADKEYKPTTKTDAFTKATRTDLVLYRGLLDRSVSCSHLGGRPPTLMALSLVKYATPAAEPAYLLQVLYSGREWLFVDGAESFQVLLGDSAHAYTPYGEAMRKVQSGVQEGQNYVVTRSDLDALTARDSVRARLSGKQGHCDWTIGPVPLELASRFARDFMSADAPATGAAVRP